jgi:hypothetical protein
LAAAFHICTARQPASCAQASIPQVAACNCGPRSLFLGGVRRSSHTRPGLMQASGSVSFETFKRILLKHLHDDHGHQVDALRARPIRSADDVLQCAMGVMDCVQVLQIFWPTLAFDVVRFASPSSPYFSRRAFCCVLFNLPLTLSNSSYVSSCPQCQGIEHPAVDASRLIVSCAFCASLAKGPIIVIPVVSVAIAPCLQPLIL